MKELREIAYLRFLGCGFSEDSARHISAWMYPTIGYRAPLSDVWRFLRLIGRVVM